MGKRPLPPLAVLQTFCAIVETGGFGRAAERMGLT
ncbi:LysR family transcriptional regulator [Rhizobium sp. CB3090]|nr:LysR family transcriptional regulator [Rhizobium sp. CB3090]WFU07674.1 LysR family transcriptional regulator [Rhizobium sp. CB3090]